MKPQFGAQRTGEARGSRTQNCEWKSRPAGGLPGTLPITLLPPGAAGGKEGAWPLAALPSFWAPKPASRSAEGKWPLRLGSSPEPHGASCLTDPRLMSQSLYFSATIISCPIQFALPY